MRILGSQRYVPKGNSSRLRSLSLVRPLSLLMAVHPNRSNMGNVSMPFGCPQPHLSQGMAMLSIHFVGSLSAAIGPCLV